MQVDVTHIGHGDVTTVSIEDDDLVVVDQMEPIDGGNILNIEYDKNSDTAFRANRTWLSLEQVKVMYELLTCTADEVASKLRDLRASGLTVRR